MSHRLRHAVAPGYLLLCLLLGGSAQAVWGNLALQLLGLAILAGAFWPGQRLAASRSAQALGWIALAAVLLVLLQLVPMPPAVWTLLPGRTPAIEGFRLLGESLPWLPLSLTPYETVASLPPLIPPLALGAAILRLGAYRSAWLALAIVAGALLSILLGTVQVSTGSFYLYRFASIGSATGFFANANFMATLLLTAIPWLAALAAGGRSGKRRSARTSLAAGPVLVLLVGLVLSRSLAALLLALPVILASLLLFAGNKGRSWRWIGLAAAVAGVAALLGFARLPAVADPNNALSTSIRAEIYRTTAQAVGDMFPVGSGAGSFARVYALHERLASYHGAYVNHAHNDYLEIALEFGLPGTVLLVLLLWWWGVRTRAIWRSPASSPFARAATVASATILAHSLVDFPARNAAIGGVLAVSAALMAEPRRRSGAAGSDRPARHLSL